MSLQDAFIWFTGLSLRFKVLAFASLVVLVELGFRRFAPKSKAYVRWTAFFQGDRERLDGGDPVRRLLPVRGRHRARDASLRQGPARPRAARRSRPSGAPTSRTRSAPWPPPATSSDADTYVLGLSCFYHDSAAALLKDGVIVAACQEERFSRKRHDSGFPAQRRQVRAARGGHRPRAARRRRLLRQAAAEVRAHALDLRRDLPALLRLVPQGDAAVAPREAVGARRSSARSCGPTRGRSSSPSTT